MGGVLTRVGSELPYTQFVGAADIDFNRAQELVMRFGGNAYKNYSELLIQEHPDVIIVATPESDHLNPVKAAAEMGCHLFVEKPLATTMEDADSIINACADADVILMVGYILRFEVSYTLIKSAIMEKSIGKFLSAYAKRVTPITEARRLNGRISPVSYIGVHDIDQMLWYHPVPVKSVYAKALYGRVWEELGTYDLAWLMIEFEDGAVGVHEVGWCLPEEWAKWEHPKSWGGFGDVGMNVIGTHGNLTLDFTPMDLFGCDREGWKLPDTRHWPTMHGKLVGAAKLELEHFFECILENKQPLVTGEDGRSSLEVILAAELSISENRIVTLPL